MSERRKWYRDNLRGIILCTLFLLLSWNLAAQSPQGGYVSPAGGGGVTVVTSLPATCSSNGFISFNGVLYSCIQGAAPIAMPNTYDNSDLDQEHNYMGNLNDSTNTASKALTNCASGSPVSTGDTISGGYVFTRANSTCFTSTAANSDKTIEIMYQFNTPQTVDFGTSATSVQWGVIAQNGGGANGTGTQLIFHNTNNSYFIPTINAAEIYAAFGAAPTVSLNTAINPQGIHYDVWVRGVAGCVATPTCAQDIIYHDGVVVTQFTAGTSPSGAQNTGVWSIGGSNKGCTVSCYGDGLTIYKTRFRTGAATQASALRDSAAGVQEALNRGLNIGATPMLNTGNELVLYGDSETVNVDPRTGAVLPPLNGQNWNFDVIGEVAANCSTLVDQAPFVLPAYIRKYGYSMIVNWCGTNDSSAGAAYGELAQLAAIEHKLGFLRVGHINMMSRTAEDPQKNALNTMLNKNSSGADFIIDVGGDSVLGCDGCSAGAGFSDGIHMTNIVGNRQHFQPLFQRAIWHQIGLVAAKPVTYKLGTQMPMNPISTQTACTGGSGSAPTCTADRAVSVGDSFFLHYVWLVGDATTMTAPTDTGGDTCTALNTRTALAATTEFMMDWTCPIGTAEAIGTEVITGHFTTANATSVQTQISVIRGTPTSGIVDANSVVATGTSANVLSAGAVSSLANELAIGSYAVCCNSGRITQGANWTNMGTDAWSAAREGTAYQILTTAASYTYSATLVNAVNTWGGAITIFKAGNFGATYNLVDTDATINADPSGGSGTLSLPDATGLNGQSICVPNLALAGSNNTITVAASNSQTINGSTNGVIVPPQGKTCFLATMTNPATPNPAWVLDSASAPLIQTVALATQYTNSTTGFTNVTGTTSLAFAIAPNTTYAMTCNLTYQAAATGGLIIEFTGPAGFTALDYNLNEATSASTVNIGSSVAYSGSIGVVVVTSGTNFPATVTLNLINGATSGTLQMLAKSSAAAQLQIQAGSSCTLIQQ